MSGFPVAGWYCGLSSKHPQGGIFWSGSIAKGATWSPMPRKRKRSVHRNIARGRSKSGRGLREWWGQSRVRVAQIAAPFCKPGLTPKGLARAVVSSFIAASSAHTLTLRRSLSARGRYPSALPKKTLETTVPFTRSARPSRRIRPLLRRPFRRRPGPEGLPRSGQTTLARRLTTCSRNSSSSWVALPAKLALLAILFLGLQN